MLNRPFTKTEKILLLLLAVLLLVLVYFHFVRRPVKQRIAAASTAELEAARLTEEAKAAKIRAMQEEMEENRNEDSGYVATYNNFNAEANALNAIFTAASSFRFNYSQPVAEEDVVRRSISIEFTADDYRVARSILRQIHGLYYRCLIRDLSISALGSGSYAPEQLPNLRNSAVSCSLNVIFYETLYDAATTDGLVFAAGSEKQERSGLAGADFSGLERSDLETVAESWANEVVNGG